MIPLPPPPRTHVERRSDAPAGPSAFVRSLLEWIENGKPPVMTVSTLPTAPAPRLRLVSREAKKDRA
jgi:hypothetical protein